MSITIHTSDREYAERRRPCSFCLAGNCQPGWCEDGIEVELVSSTPEANIANDNARSLFATLGIMWEPDGELLPHELPEIIATAEAGLGDDVDALLVRAPMLREPDGWHGSGGVRIIVCGSDDYSAHERLQRVLEVLRSAAARGVGVRWY